FAYGMSCAVYELPAVARALDDAARYVVNICAFESTTSAHVLLHEPYGGIARLAHYIEDSRVLFGHSFANVTRPGLIRVNRQRLLQLCRDIKQNEIAALNRRGYFARRRVMRIRSVRIHGYN